MLALSLVLVSRSLAASAPVPDAILVDPGKGSLETAAPPPADPIVATPPPDQHFLPSLRDLISPAALRRLVAIRSAHPRPMRPAVECMARTVYREAANQALWGQLAVAQVILNRTKSRAFPHSVCGVVGQPGQFSEQPVRVAPATARPWGAAVAIATIAEDEQFPQIAPGALFFHAAYMRPAWSQDHQRIAQIGDHIFYR